jgi:Undecaprenyl-phosphate glucose phosphotransferase
MSVAGVNFDEGRHTLPADMDAEVDRGMPAIERRGPLRPNALATSRSRAELGGVDRVFRWVELCVIIWLGMIAADITDLPAFLSTPVSGVLPIGIGVPIMCISLRWTRAKVMRRPKRWYSGFGRVLVGLAVAGVVVGLLIGTLSLTDEQSDAAERWFLESALAVLVLRLIWAFRLRQLFNAGKLTPNIVIVGATPNASLLIARARETGEVAVLGVFDDRSDRVPPNIGGVRVLGNIDSMFGHRIMPYVDRVVITVSTDARERLRQLTARLHLLPNEVSLLVDVEGQMDISDAASGIAGIPLARVSGNKLDEERIIAKRAQDIVLGTLMFVGLLPIMAVIALLVRLDSRGPVFFRQSRHGFNNEVITVWKFRTMRADLADFSASQQIRVNDERVTRIGRILRKTSLDELPQLINVLNGEMSLVGPRPHAIGMKTGSEESARLVAEYAHRHRIKPGVTGWAAINGSRGAVDTVEAVRKRVALDISYIERQSFWLDLYIIIMTLPCLLGDRSAVR